LKIKLIGYLQILIGYNGQTHIG